MKEYTKQALDFLRATGSKIEVRFLKHGVHFPGDTDTRNIYEVVLSRDSRKYTFEFGDSIDRYNKELAKFFPGDDNINDTKQQIANGATFSQLIGYPRNLANRMLKFRKYQEKAREWSAPGVDGKPSAYSLLACLDASDCWDDVDDFAEEFGYTKPSVAIKVFESVQKQIKGLRELYNDKEIEQLNEIQ